MSCFTLKARKRLKESKRKNRKGEVVSCPLCGLTMVYATNNKLFCPDCGLSESED